MARNIMEQLITKGKVTRGYLGVVIQDVTDKLAQTMNLPHANGALVSQVAGGSPAEKAGMEVGDFITTVDGKRVENVNDLRNAVAAIEPESTVPVTVLRDGDKETLQVTIALQPEDMTAAFGGPSGPGSTGPAQTAERFGLTVNTLSEGLADKYGYEPDEAGVVITAVTPTSDAAEQGLAEGMLIKKAQGKAVTSVAELTKILSADDADRGVVLLVKDPSGGQRFVLITPDDED
jgi:serine protease Do